MKILGNRVLVSKVEEEKKDGFQTVEVQDSFIYKGKVEQIGVENWVRVSADSETEEVVQENIRTAYKVGDIILFAKYSPDTQDIEHEGKKYKVVNVEDIIAIL